jgi:hypothetical protein
MGHGMIALTARNGLLRDDELVVIDTAGHRLRPDAAASLVRMRAAGAPIGTVTSAYRSRVEQAHEVERAKAGLTPSAAAVGKSWHGEGLAVDFPEPARAWVRRWGGPHGWAFPLTKEPWHGQYDPARDRHAASTPPAPAPAPVSPPVPQQEEETIMRELVESLYRAHLDRSGAVTEVDKWTVEAAAAGLTAKQLVIAFDGARAEPGAVRAAFRDFLGHTPSPEQITTWLASSPTIAQVRAGVAGSDEAKAHQ